MKKIESVLKEELVQLKKASEMARQRLLDAPKGTLRIRNWRGKVEYYYRNSDMENFKEKRENGRYLKKAEAELAREIAQRDYDRQVVKRADARIKIMEQFLKVYSKTDLKQLYQETNPFRRNLISAEIISDEEYVKRWQAVGYNGKEFADEENEIITERGERVRSKSEKIIADKLNALGIVYRYEYPLMLAGGVRMYPDFTILKMPERKEVYLEHFGMMDDADYMENVVYKLNTYEKNKIYLGDTLFLTHETSRNPLNTRALDGMLRSIFCEETL